MGTARKRRGDQHARVYRYERETEAYRSLSCTARALLIEFRLLYNGWSNRIPMSVREAARRLGVSPKPATKALSELLDRGFIVLIQKGAFHNKESFASVYALANEPIDDRDGAVAPKGYMKWRKSTVVDSPTAGSRTDYRGAAGRGDERSNGSRIAHREECAALIDGGHSCHTDKLPGGRGELSSDEAAA